MSDDTEGTKAHPPSEEEEDKEKSQSSVAVDGDSTPEDAGASKGASGDGGGVGSGGGGDGEEDQKIDNRSGDGDGDRDGNRGRVGKIVETTVMRPSVFSVPVVAYRALRSRLDLWWIKTSIDPHFDELEFLSNAVDAYAVVMERFADNEMNALNPMLSTKVFNAFRDTWIDYDRQNLAIELVVDKNENPVVVEAAVSAGIVRGWGAGGKKGRREVR